jgi:hypothetical protein
MAGADEINVGHRMKARGTSFLSSLILLSASVSAAPSHIEAGPLQIDLTVSRTAHLFYVVDQMSRWDYFCHPEYASNIGPLNRDETGLLGRHRAIRSNHSWGDNLEKAFYTDLDLDAALSRGIQLGWLTSGEAEIEKEVLMGLAPRVDDLLNRQRSLMDAFTEHLKQDIPKISATARLLQRFTGVSPDAIPVFLFATPSTINFGGGFNSGMLTLEIPTQADAYPVFLHEVFHAFLKPRKEEIERAVQGVAGLDEQTLEEGIAHALVPGLIGSRIDSSDPLLSDVQQGIKEHKTMSDPSTRFYRFALALRPLLRDALDDDHQTLSSFLPRAVDVWKATVELNRVIDSTNH